MASNVIHLPGVTANDNHGSGPPDGPIAVRRMLNDLMVELTGEDLDPSLFAFTDWEPLFSKDECREASAIAYDDASLSIQAVLMLSVMTPSQMQEYVTRQSGEKSVHMLGCMGEYMNRLEASTTVARSAFARLLSTILEAYGGGGGPLIHEVA